MALPPLLRCRGMQIRDDIYIGCAYGSGDARVLTGPMDCPTCNGSGYEGATATWLPHADFGDEDCPGFLYGIADNDRGYVFCIECDAIVRELPANELQATLTEMELTLDTCTEQCPPCKSVNLIAGFSKMSAYT